MSQSMVIPKNALIQFSTLESAKLFIEWAKAHCYNVCGYQAKDLFQFGCIRIEKMVFASTGEVEFYKGRGSFWADLSQPEFRFCDPYYYVFRVSGEILGGVDVDEDEDLSDLSSLL